MKIFNKEISFKGKTNPHLESLERRIKTNEEYLETMVAGTEEYKAIQEALSKDYEEVRKMKEPKIKFGDIVAILGVGVSALGVLATVETSKRRDETKKEIAQLAYKKEEQENELKNGTVMNLAMKD